MLSSAQSTCQGKRHARLALPAGNLLAENLLMGTLLIGTGPELYGGNNA